MKTHPTKTGTEWRLWRWHDIDSGLISRLYLLETPWFAICLNWLNKPDPEPYLHDHPASFLSIVLRGWYTEERSTPAERTWPDHPSRVRNRSWFNFIRAHALDRHRITYVAPSTLTPCFMGTNVRTWGFHRPGGWISGQDYYDLPKAER